MKRFYPKMGAEAIAESHGGQFMHPVSEPGGFQAL